VVVSRAVMRKAFVGALLALLAAAALPAQEAPPETPTPALETLASGTGSLVVGGAATALPWIETREGPLVALAPLVERLGGRLDVGAFGASFTLTLGESAFVLADGSAAITRGAEIVPLSQPVRVVLGAPHVPVDLVTRVWGAIGGVTAAWNPAAKRLEASRPEARELPVEVSVVHAQGVSTVVLRFPTAPRLRVEPRDGGWEVLGVGDRFVAAPPRQFADPLLRVVAVAADRITLLVADGVAGEHYRLGAPDRLVFDLYQPGQAAQAAAATPTPPTRRTLRTVVIDPGHGGSETGAVGPAGTMEKELTLALSRALAERLGQELGLRVALTRTDDVDLGLDERSAFANQNKADLFLSVHLNSTARGDADGAETYFLSLQASDERAADAAALENLVGEAAASPGSAEFDVQLMLWDLAQSEHLAASQRLANLIQEELNRSLSLPDRGVKQAPFRVLMGAAMPAVLVELGFISSAAEERRLRDPEYRAGLVATLVRAIGRFKSEYDAASEAPGAPR
jgi:N-acetylmuramoyl-L-alanine amidase